MDDGNNDSYCYFRGDNFVAKLLIYTNKMNRVINITMAINCQKIYCGDLVTSWTAQAEQKNGLLLIER